MSVPQVVRAEQAQIPPRPPRRAPGTTPETSRPTPGALDAPAGTTPDAPGTTDATPGTTAPACVMVPPPDALAFSRPCPRCRAIVSLPWCPILTAVLDRLDALEALPIEIAVLHARLGWVEGALRDLQAHDEEVQP